MESKPFGFSYLVDAYDCLPGACDDLELHYRFLQELVFRIDMTPMGNPITIHAPVRFEGKQRIEIYPDKAGVSAWIPLVESGAQIHSCEPANFSSLDCYSCNEFDKALVWEIFQEYFGFKDYEDNWIVRGKKYHK